MPLPALRVSLKLFFSPEPRGLTRGLVANPRSKREVAIGMEFAAALSRQARIEQMNKYGGIDVLDTSGGACQA